MPGGDAWTLFSDGRLSVDFAARRRRIYGWILRENSETFYVYRPTAGSRLRFLHELSRSVKLFTYPKLFGFPFPLLLLIYSPYSAHISLKEQNMAFLSYLQLML